MVAGEDANVVIFDPAVQWRGDKNALASRATNTPYDGRALVGKVRTTIVKGRLVVHEGALQ